ncbi:uncharacterized protein BN515_01361 [Firmicutes bacterium CAG:170]|nr:uncharacterized protein BN515_01361 [Firmicutes bacterium CAG:170]
MIRHTALREIVGADAFVAHSGADLTAALRGDLVFDAALLDLIELGRQHLHTPRAVLHLRAFLLTRHDDAGRLVDKPDGGRGLVDMLATRSGRAEHLHFDVLGPDLDLRLLHFREHRDRRRRGMHPSAGFCLRHALHPVDAGFKLEPGVGSVAVDHEIRFLDAAKLRLVIVEQLDRPAAAVSIHRVHPEQAVRKKGALLAADTAADLHDHALFVIRVLRQKEDLQLLLQRLLLLLRRREFLLTQSLHLRVQLARHHLPQLKLLLLRAAKRAIGRDDRLKLPLLLEESGRRLRVGKKFRLCHALGGLHIPFFHQL